jgi:hypothetical protein
MNPRKFRALISMLACGLWLAACSKDTPSAADTAASISAVTASSDSDSAVAEPGDPCGLVTDSEVRKLYEGAKAGTRDHSLDKYGIAMCTRDTPTNVFVAQLYKSEGTPDEEVRTRALGVIDPVRQGAGSHFRYEAVAGIGDAATVLAEAGDPASGIYNDIALIAVSKGDQTVVLFSRTLIDGDREATVKALEALGRSAAARL